MEKKTETKLRHVFRLSEKTREDGGPPCDAHDAGAAFMTPPLFQYRERAGFPAFPGFSLGSFVLPAGSFRPAGSDGMEKHGSCF